jgi:hypothetical protein
MNYIRLAKLGQEINKPCLTISFNTHRTHPDNLQDKIMLKNFLSQAKERLLLDYDKNSIHALLEKLDKIEDKIDINYNLDSLHIFLSNDTEEIIKSPWQVEFNAVHIADKFAIKALIKAFNRTENYLILLLSQSAVSLYQAINDKIYKEIKNDVFPITNNIHYLTNIDKINDSKKVDNMIREFFNTVDFAIQKEYNESFLKIVVVSTEKNYTNLIEVAHNSKIYSGHVLINYNNDSLQTIETQTWEFIQTKQKQARTDAIKEMEDSISKGNVLTDLTEIYRAAKEGRAELLIISEDYHQSVKMTGDFSFELIDDLNQANVIEDISNEISWEVISKKGRVIYTCQDELKTMGNIVLKVRY